MGYFLTYKQRQGVVNSNSHKRTNRYAQSTVSSRSRHSSPRQQGVTDYRGCFGPPIPPCRNLLDVKASQRSHSNRHAQPTVSSSLRISTPASPKMLHSNGVFLSPMETGDLTPCQQRGPFMTFSTSKPGSASRSRRLAYSN